MVSIQKIYQLFLNHPRISTDTRKDVKDTLFFALSGENFNGNTFAKAALENGARTAIVDDPSVAIDDRYLLVDDVLSALQELARMHRARNLIPLLAITGSNGKTTTKNLIRAVLSAGKKIIATEGNFNNHIGVPITLLGIRRDTELAVVEMGANHVSEIGQLCQIALPDTGIITNIGKAHLEGFGGFEGVVKAKGEMYDFLRQTHGTVIINADDPLLMELSSGIKRFTYGKSGAQVTGTITRYNPFLSVKWQYEGHEYSMDTFLYGKYNYYNIMAAIAAGIYYNIPVDHINEAIAAFRSENNRSQLMRTDTNEIIMDAYNANPVSMSEAIQSFREARKENPWLILGDMFELGESAEEEHKAIIDLLISCRFDQVLLAGEIFSKIKIPESYKSFKTTGELEHYLLENPIRHAHILIKGSRGMYLEKTLNVL
ncbi:MAG: UDP-N-acetylmuramoyl-tripeptide--D-alanyl-D-alanine ligase [bacterium]